MSETREDYIKYVRASELSYLEWWFKNPTVEPKISEKDFSSRVTRDLFHVLKLNRRHNGNRFMNQTEILQALANNEKYTYLLNEPDLLIDVMSGVKYSFNCEESFRVTEKWLAERGKNSKWR